MTLRVCDLASDGDLVEAAHVDARAICDVDPGLVHPLYAPLARECRDRFGAYFEEVGQA